MVNFIGVPYKGEIAALLLYMYGYDLYKNGHCYVRVLYSCINSIPINYWFVELCSIVVYDRLVACVVLLIAYI